MGNYVDGKTENELYAATIISSFLFGLLERAVMSFFSLLVFYLSKDFLFRCIPYLSFLPDLFFALNILFC